MNVVGFELFHIGVFTHLRTSLPLLSAKFMVDKSGINKAEVGTIPLFESFELPFEFLWMPDIVGVEKGDEFSFRLRDTCISSVRNATVFVNDHSESVVVVRIGQ